MKRSISLMVAATTILVASGARAQQIKARVMVILDTSGSMGFYFRDPQQFNLPPNGDYPGGDGSFSYTDGGNNNLFLYPGKRIMGTCAQNNTTGCEGRLSRLYAAKHALSDAVNGYGGDIDFGLETFDFQLCPYNNPRCEPCQLFCGQLNCGFNGCCGYTCLYANNAFNALVSTNWISQACMGPGNGGRIITIPGIGSGPKILPWIDDREDHRTSGDGNNAFGIGSTPLNPEIRAEGNTPLAEALNVARTGWYDPIKNGNQDPLINCRQYAVVLATDGVQSVNGGCGANPVTAATALYNDNPANRVLTYVIGVSTTPQDQMQLNAIAAAGGTGSARIANSQVEIGAAFADIASASVKFEICNRLDDTCDGFIDEGLGVYQECKMNNQCASGTCNGGRCTCANNGQCANGFTCGGGFCVPSCTIGQGTCQRAGVLKCGGGGGPACCVNDGQAACAMLMPGAPGVEVCNGTDDNCNGLIDENGVCQMCQPVAETCDGKDNDCNGAIDNNLIDVNRPCGLNLGICKPGTTVCVNGMNQDILNGGIPNIGDHLICQGGVAPQMEACNNLDDDCDGIVDGMTRNCYGGPMGTDGVGICHGGQQKCTAGVFGVCVGEVVPRMEICDGLDNDCNGKIDDVMGAGQACCPSGKCGMGICTPGSMQCSGGILQCLGGQGPLGEVCNGVDDDCNGKVDDLPGLGNNCVPQNGCGGTLVCDPMLMMVICKPNGQGGKEICNGMDDNCNGKIDEEPDVTMNDPNVGQPCGNPMNLPLPCKAGKTICKNGMIVCDGAVGPGMEVCDGLDNDCDGNPDDMAPCPPQFVCYDGECDPLCQQGEFPCPGGYTPVTVNGVCICVADKNCNPPCKVGESCDTQTGMCVDKCAKVTCNPPFKCDQGVCYGCEHFGCGNCQRCDKASHLCVEDKCCNVNCEMGKFCDPSNGMCVGTCPNGCPSGQICSNGTCVEDKCAGKKCVEGEACDPNTGLCAPNACFNKSCAPNLACCNAACVADPCAPVKCPAQTACHVNPLSCQITCDAVPQIEKEAIVGAGGGGFACAAAPGGRSGPGALLGLLAVLGLIAARRRRDPGDAVAKEVR